MLPSRKVLKRVRVPSGGIDRKEGGSRGGGGWGTHLSRQTAINVCSNYKWGRWKETVDPGLKSHKKKNKKKENEEGSPPEKESTNR